MIQLQTEGVAALCNILNEHNVAYLADEVGLGKTMQALGVIGYYRKRQRASRILIISPRENVQDGWSKEFERFRSYAWNGELTDIVHQSYPSLKCWLNALRENQSISLLRHTSFARPIFLGSARATWSEAISHPDLAGIYTLPQSSPTCNDDERSFVYNQAFAKYVNRWFALESIYFDLVVVDEAQCLRNETNQSNTVLRTMLQGRVKRWLFLSATPAHSGVGNICTVLNNYPDNPKIRRIDPAWISMDDDFKTLKDNLAKYMIRRPRTYRIGDQTLYKSSYRQDDLRSLAITCKEPLDILSISLVQKKLVRVLQGRGNRFRSGYMASFESLDDSLRGSPQPLTRQRDSADPDAEQDVCDFFTDISIRPKETMVPDAGFVSTLSRDFVSRFQFNLPHPKVDKVEDNLALAAFGNRNGKIPGGIKTLVFCRRISSVDVLRSRLLKRYLTSIEDRCKSQWKMTLNWDQGFSDRRGNTLDQDVDFDGDDSIDNPSDENRDDNNKFRLAMREKKWLHRFRLTFNDGQRNALFFEQNWFVRLCRIGGVDPIKASRSIPHVIWTESNTFSMRNGKRMRRRQFRYVVWNCVKRAPHVFGLSAQQARTWLVLLGNIYSEEVQTQAASSSDERNFASEAALLHSYSSIWTRVEQFDLAALFPLPTIADGSNCESVYWRQILENLLGQYMRLTDTLIDLYCADHGSAELGPAESRSKFMLERFISWLSSDDIDAKRLQQIWRAWSRNYVLIFSSAIGETEANPLEKQVRQESFDFLSTLDPVVGVIGGSKGHKRPIQQFNTPGMPYIMVGTDTIREGVNLHLFCDRVMHYGLAWTAGDLEQRIGRVDRYFSQIERRLNYAASSDEPSPKLNILYPYLRDTLERQQIEAVMERKRQSDAAVDTDFVSVHSNSDDEILIDAVPPRSQLESARPKKNVFDAIRHLPKSGQD